MSDWEPPTDLDAEVYALCAAMNALPGIETTGSCCGHGKAPFRIWFETGDLRGRGLVTLARVTCSRYYPFDAKIYIDHGDIHPIHFILELPVGAYAQADMLAAAIMDHVLDRTEGFNILLDDTSSAYMSAYIEPPPTHCKVCGAEYRNIQHPLKPLGVIMQRLCDCKPVTTIQTDERGNSVQITTLVPPERP